MKKLLLLTIAIALLATGCISLGPQTSICDDVKTGSYLCQVADDNDTRIEDVGNLLIIANSVAIGQGAYTREEALVTLRHIRRQLDHPVSYLFIRDAVISATSSYPGLFEVATLYMMQFDRPQLMFVRDRMILTRWLDNYITMLGG